MPTTTSGSPASSSTSTASPPGSRTPTAPYALTWDTRTSTNGGHTLTARARDAAGNSTLSSGVTVNVANANFFQNEVLATGFDLPTAMKFLPDGRLLVSELAGRIRVLQPPYTAVDPTPFLQISNIGSAGVQQGIYDFAFDPNFATNRFFYVFYTLGTPNRDRLSRFTANAAGTGTVAGSELVLYTDPTNANAEHHGGAINVRQRRQAVLHHRRALRRRRRPGPRQPPRQDPPDQPRRHGPDRQPVLRRRRAELGQRLGPRPAQPVPGVLRCAVQPPVHRRRRRQRLRHGQGGDQRRCPRRQLRLAELRGQLQRVLHQPDPLLGPQRARLRRDRRLRVPRHAVPGLVPGQLLLRRLHPELDPPPHVRRQRQRDGRQQLRAGRRLRRRALRRHRLHGRRSGRRAVLPRPRLLGHQRPVRHQQDPPDPLRDVEPVADRDRRGEPDVGSDAAVGEPSRAPGRSTPRVNR